MLWLKSFPIPIVLSFRMGMFTLSHCIVSVFSFTFYVDKSLQLRVCPSLRGDFKLELFSNAGTIRALGTQRESLNALCIEMDMSLLKAMDGILWFRFEVSS